MITKFKLYEINTNQEKLIEQWVNVIRYELDIYYKRVFSSGMNTFYWELYTDFHLELTITSGNLYLKKFIRYEGEKNHGYNDTILKTNWEKGANIDDFLDKVNETIEEAKKAKTIKKFKI